MTSPSFNALLPRLRGATLVGEPLGTIARVHTDTRSLQPGDLFVALKGERFDAHDYLSQAQAAGAVAAIAASSINMESNTVCPTCTSPSASSSSSDLN